MQVSLIVNNIKIIVILSLMDQSSIFLMGLVFFSKACTYSVQKELDKKRVLSSSRIPNKV